MDKPAGLTSHDVVARVRRLAGTRRVGHAGTLDPMATGVLVLGLGRATKLLHFLTGADKEYSATIRLGQASTTDDAEGELTPVGDAAFSTDQIADALVGLRGDIMQVPSAVSAIKVAGKRAYQRVRAGENVQLAARPVRVSRFEMLGAPRAAGTYTDVDVAVECSSGTYVRALARDLGHELGSGGHLTALRRTRVGPWTIEDAHPLPAQAVTGEPPDQTPRPAQPADLPMLGLAPVLRALYPAASLAPAQIERFAHGGAPDVASLALPGDLVDGNLLALLSAEQPTEAIGLVRLVGGKLKTEFVARPAQ